LVLGSATPSLETRYNAERGKYTLLELPGRIERVRCRKWNVIDMRQEFLETRKQATFSRALDRRGDRAPGERRADHAAAEPARLFELSSRAARAASGCSA
jgi:primosomal protein N'